MNIVKLVGTATGGYVVLNSRLFDLFVESRRVVVD